LTLCRSSQTLWHGIYLMASCRTCSSKILFRRYLLTLCLSSQTLLCSYLLTYRPLYCKLPTDLVSHGVDELVHVSLQEVVEAGHAPELIVVLQSCQLTLYRIELMSLST
jgi:hypothetical protein